MKFSVNCQEFILIQPSKIRLIVFQQNILMFSVDSVDSYQIGSLWWNEHISI